MYSSKPTHSHHLKFIPYEAGVNEPGRPIFPGGTYQHLEVPTTILIHLLICHRSFHQGFFLSLSPNLQRKHWNRLGESAPINGLMILVRIYSPPFICRYTNQVALNVLLIFVKAETKGPSLPSSCSSPSSSSSDPYHPITHHHHPHPDTRVTQEIARSPDFVVELITGSLWSLPTCADKALPCLWSI